VYCFAYVVRFTVFPLGGIVPTGFIIISSVTNSVTSSIFPAFWVIVQLLSTGSEETELPP
jgi:hypothetical protein